MVGAAESDWAAVDSADADRLIAGLDRIRDEPFFTDAKARMLSLVPGHDGVRVVDVGCGTGEDAAAIASVDVIGLDRSVRMTNEARRRHRELLLAVADGRRLPIASGSVDAVRADRVLQHLAAAQVALVEWRRVLRRGGALISFDPDLTTATVEGVDQELAARVLTARADTRAGAETVRKLDHSLGAAGFDEVTVARSVVELTSLDQADGIFGLESWGARVGEAERWNDAVQAANADDTLAYRCEYVLGVGRVSRRWKLPDLAEWHPLRRPNDERGQPRTRRR
jgi:ubiquinone/menaquinone biosynthesis C-methylase UbiE